MAIWKKKIKLIKMILTVENGLNDGVRCRLQDSRSIAVGENDKNIKRYSYVKKYRVTVGVVN